MHEFFFENLRNPARSRRAGLMRQFHSGQLNSRDFLTWLVEGPMAAKQFCTVTLNNTCFCIFFYVNTIDDKLKCSQSYSYVKIQCSDAISHRFFFYFLFISEKFFTRTQYPDTHTMTVTCALCQVMGTKFSTYPETKFSTKYLVY